jgi:hypothetical protein
LTSLAIPRWMKNLMLRSGFKTPYPMTLLEYDFNDLKKKFEAKNFECEILNFPDQFWSRDFRLTRTNLLIRIPQTAQSLPETTGSKTDKNISVNIA